MKRLRSIAPLSLMAVMAYAFLARLPVSASWAPRRRHSAFTKSHSPPKLHMVLSDGWFSFQQAILNHVDIDNDSNRTPRIVLLIPAFNEENRIQSTLQTYREFLREANWTSEILVIDDGSTDETVRVVNSFLECSSDETVPVLCLSMPRNRGKGAALAAGIKHIAEQCRGNKKNATLILTQDADGSGDLVYLQCMIDRMKDLLAATSEANDDDDEHETLLTSPIDWTKPAIVTGNRNYNILSPRGITRWGFQTAVRLIMNDLRVQDSQCGYKLMTLTAAKDLYADLEVNGWAHDVEVLYRAKLVDIPIEQISINWTDKDGSKVVESGVARVSLQMLLDVIRLRWEYSNLRAWLSLGDF